jgi:hypothetical protein
MDAAHAQREITLKTLTKVLAALAVVAATSGCAVNRATATIDSTVDLDKVKTVYVTKLAADGRGVNEIIAEKLRSRGLSATTGSGKIEGVDAIVTYADKWMWTSRCTCSSLPSSSGTQERLSACDGQFLSHIPHPQIPEGDGGRGRREHLRRGESKVKQELTRGLAVAWIVAVVAVLSGCAAPASKESMAVPAAAVSTRFPYSVSVVTRGGADTGAMDSSNIADADLKVAIESSITQTRLFKAVVQGKSGDYDLAVTVFRLTKPSFGASFTVDLEVGWVLTKTSDKSILLRKSIRSAHTASMGDSLVGVTRLRLAVEGAARANITQGLQAIAELNL